MQILCIRVICYRNESGSLVTTVDIYDANSNTWNSTDMGAGSLSIAANRRAVAALGSKVLFAGGYVSSDGTYGSSIPITDVVDIYDVVTRTWDSRARLSKPRGELAAAGAGTKMVFAGGLYVHCLFPVLSCSSGFSGGPEPYIAVTTVDIYDIVTGVWTSSISGAGSLSAARADLSGITLGARLVIFAGGIVYVAW